VYAGRMTRLATIDDLNDVYTIYMCKEVIPYLGYDVMPIAEFGPIYAELLDSNAFYIYELDGKTAGFYRVIYGAGRSKHVATLSTLAVSPEYHGKGIAKDMLEGVFADLKKEGITRVELRVESDNHRGIRFYEKLGFQKEGTLKSRYKRSGDPDYIDNHIMGMCWH